MNEPVIAYCGLNCHHCFLGQWCGGCRTGFNCCKEKGYEGCWQCADIQSCTKGFYQQGSDGANASKAQALFVAKYGKNALLEVSDLMYQKYDFKKIQEVLNEGVEGSLKILETIYENK